MTFMRGSIACPDSVAFIGNAALGRWFGVDPKGQLMPYNSLYAAMMNNPVTFTDPDGECPICVALIIGAVVNVATNWSAISSAGSFGKGFGMTLGYAGVGALQGATSLIGGPAGFALGGAINGLGNGLIQGQTGNQLLSSTGIGAVSGLAGGTAARHAGKLVGDIASPLLDGLAKGAVGGSAGGFAGGGVASLLMGENFLDGAISGAWKGAAFGAGIGGAANSYMAAKSGFNPITGQRTNSWLANNPPKSFTINVERPKLSVGSLEKRQIRGNIYDADFEIALKEWNNIKAQYNQKPYHGTSYRPDGFSISLPNGSIVSGQLYYGGNTNSAGYNIKITTIPPPNGTRIPPIYLRYLK